jgi:hypothetical protein
MNPLAPKIVVEANPDYFTFTSSTSSTRFNTFLYLTVKDGQLYRIVSVGEEVSGIQDAVKVSLFRLDATPVTNDKKRCLEAFFRYGIMKSHPLPLLLAIWIHPTLIFRGIHSFDSILTGYQKGLFELVAKEAGAGDVVFE